MDRRLLTLLALLCLPCCRAVGPEPEPSAAPGAPAGLSLTVSIPAAVTKSPGYAGGEVSAEDAASWNEWDRLVDGQSFYRLTLLLVRQPDNVLVGYRDLYAGSPDWCADAEGCGLNGFCSADGTLLPAPTRFASQARVHFNYLHPMHGEPERLASGSYRLYGLANYSAVSAVPDGGAGSSWGGLAGPGGSLEDILTGTGGVIPAFLASGDGLPAFDADSRPGLFGFTVRSAGDGEGGSAFVCPRTPQPLAFVTDFFVLSGDNQVEARLLRTSSRLRFVIHNESPTEPLTVTSFAFVSDLSRDEAPLLDFGTDEGYAVGTPGRPSLTSPEAITPYPGDGVLVVPPGGDGVVYDAYVLGSKLSLGGERYRYRLGVSYSETATTNYYIYDGQPIRTLDGLRTALNNRCSKYLVLQNGVGKGFLYDAEGTVSDEAYRDDLVFLEGNVRVSSKTNLALQPVGGASFRDIDLNVPALRKFIWTVERLGETAGNWEVYVQNAGTERYWSDNIVNGTSPRLQTVLVGYRSYRVEEWSQPGLVFRDMGTPSSEVYLHKDRYGTATKSKDTLWALYALDDGVPASADRVVTLQVVDPVTRQSADMLELRRNDFVTVNVFTNIHPDGGTLEMKVLPWEGRTADFEYD